MLKPLLYDFKRCFFRPSTLFLISLFTVIGGASSYFIYLFLISISPPVNALIIISDNGVYCSAVLVVYNSEVRTVDFRAKAGDVEILGHGVFREKNGDLCRDVSKNTVVEVEAERFRRVFRLERIEEGNYTIFLYGRSVNLVRRYVFSPVENTTHSELRGVIVSDFLRVEKNFGRALFLGVNLTNGDFHGNVSVGFIEARIGFQTHGAISISAEDLGNLIFVNQSFFEELLVLDTYLSKDHDAVVYKVEADNAVYYFSYVYRYSIPVESEDIYVLTSTSGLSFFIVFFPVLFIYLCETLVCKPRSTGALEFILARPVTKWDIYVSRYLAGVLTAVVSTVAFLLAMNATYMVLFGETLCVLDNTLLFLGITARLVVFYTICFAIASCLEPRLYLLTTIVIYIVFSFLWNTVLLASMFIASSGFNYDEFLETSFRASYLNPLSSTDWAMYFIQKKHGLTDILERDPGRVLNPYLAVATQVIWALLFFIIGYVVFKRGVVFRKTD